MTNEEKNARMQHLQEEQLALAAIMSQSDAHAAKCVKLGLSFAETYPEEFAEYSAARDMYNENEQALAELGAAPTEEPMFNHDNQ